MCRFFLKLEHFAAPAIIQYLSVAPGNKKPPATVSRGAIF
ncbi:hypothetical protein ABIE49_005180 [Bradyrhizobium sp. OAE829]